MGINNKKFTIAMINCSQCNYLFKAILPFCVRCGKDNIYEKQEVEKILENKITQFGELNNIQHHNQDSQRITAVSEKETTILSSLKDSQILTLLCFFLFLMFGIGVLIFFIPEVFHYLFVIILGIMLVFIPLLITTARFSNKPNTCQFSYEDD